MSGDVRPGDRVTYQGQRWIVRGRAPATAAGSWWRLVRRGDGDGWVSVLAQQGALSEIERPAFTVGAEVTVGTFRYRATVVAVEGSISRPLYVVEFPEQVRRTAGGVEWLRDESTARVGAENLNI